MTKKRFAVSSDTTNAISAVMEMASNHQSKFSNTLIDIKKIQLDPDNPRNHAITISDITQGLKTNDFMDQKKHEEYEGLLELSQSIKKEGLINPIIVYKEGTGYRLIAGERRLLASLLAAKTHIEARAFLQKPTKLDIAFLQWAENESRKDLSLKSRLANVMSVIDVVKQDQPNVSVTSQLLADVLSVSRALAGSFLSILNNSVLMALVNDGSVTSYRKAREMASLQTTEEMLAFLHPENIVKLPAKGLTKQITKDKSKKTGRKRLAINMGKTKNTRVIKCIVDSVMAQYPMNELKKDIQSIDWNCIDQASKLFTKLIAQLEKKAGGFNAG